MADPLRHRQTKGAATDMVDLTPPRHISTLPISAVRVNQPEPNEDSSSAERKNPARHAV